MPTLRDKIEAPAVLETPAVKKVEAEEKVVINSKKKK